MHITSGDQQQAAAFEAGDELSSSRREFPLAAHLHRDQSVHVSSSYALPKQRDANAVPDLETVKADGLWVKHLKAVSAQKQPIFQQRNVQDHLLTAG